MKIPILILQTLFCADSLLQRLPNAYIESVNCNCSYNSKCAVYRLSYRCDGHGDCLTHEDEHNCQFCEPEVEFTCYDHSRCIPQSWTCDQTIDCNDGSDELNCHNKTAIEECAFKCTNGTCLSLDSVCNNITDCADGSDEFNNCGM